MNYLWGFMIIIGVIYGACTGNLTAVTDQALSSAKEAITLCITMAGVMALWVGIMEIAEHSGLIARATRALHPVLSFLFPQIPKEHKARSYIATNMIANMFGLGWAATPAGLSAMKELKNLNGDSEIASDAMCDFLIINISSLQLIPINIVAYRGQYGSVNPTYIVGPALLATCISTGTAVLFICLMHRIRRGNRGGHMSAGRPLTDRSPSGRSSVDRSSSGRSSVDRSPADDPSERRRG